MALGYEGVIMLGSSYALGTGASVPRSLSRMESSSGYGGKKSIPAVEMGIGLPHEYDWTGYDGSLNFDVSYDFLSTELKPWIFDRQSAKRALFRSRNNNIQRLENCYFNNISLSASDGAVVDGSVGFVAIDREEYVWGDPYINNTTGMGVLCGGSFPSPLNSGTDRNRNPVPFWKTKIIVGTEAEPRNFTTWTLDYSQDIVKFFGCADNYTEQPPLFIAAGPMSVTFSGSYMENFPSSSNSFLGDSIPLLVVYIDDIQLILKRLEVTSENDDVQSGEALVPLSVEYAVYEIAA